MKHLAFILCAIMTCIIIFASLFLPQLGFTLLDEKKETDVFTEQADAVTSAENLTQANKLMVIAQSYGYKESVPVRSSGFFLKTGEEIAEKDLLQVIRRELTLFDPSDYLGYFAALKNSGDQPQLTANLENIVQYSDTPMSFPVWRASVTAAGLIYHFTLDAVSGKVYSIYAYLTDSAYEAGRGDGNVAASPSDGEEQYGLTSVFEPELLSAFGAYLGYPDGNVEWMEAGGGLSAGGYVYPVNDQKFALTYYNSGYDLSLTPILL